MIYEERQQSWGWAVATYVFLAGVGGSTFLFGFILNMLGMYEMVHRISALVGPVLVLLGTFFLLADLGSIPRAYRLFTTPATLLTSWMVRSAWIVVAFTILGLAYALPGFKPFEILPWNQASSLGQGIGIASALLSFLVVIDPGFLFGVLKSIPFWNTPILPLLFLLSGLATGMAILVLISLAFPAVIGAGGFHLLGVGGMLIIILLLIILGAYQEIFRQSGTTGLASVRLLTTPLFIFGVVIFGLLVPFTLLLYSIFVTDALTISVLAGIAGVLILVGGLLLRYSIIRAGVRIAVREFNR
jgi:polysulfide reductase chain C